MHRNYDSKIQCEQAAHNSPNPLSHCNPDDWYETQIKMIVAPVFGSEHHPEDGCDRQNLAAGFRKHCKSKSSSLRTGCSWMDLEGCCRDPITDGGQHMDEQKRRNTNQANRVPQEPADGGRLPCVPSDAAICNQARNPNDGCCRSCRRTY